MGKTHDCTVSFTSNLVKHNTNSLRPKPYKLPTLSYYDYKVLRILKTRIRKTYSLRVGYGVKVKEMVVKSKSGSD